MMPPRCHQRDRAFHISTCTLSTCTPTRPHGARRHTERAHTAADLKGHRIGTVDRGLRPVVTIASSEGWQARRVAVLVLVFGAVAVGCVPPPPKGYVVAATVLGRI